VECYKARLIAKGFAQVYGVDYEVTFALVARLLDPYLQLLLFVIGSYFKWMLKTHSLMVIL
jgi:hypothetical protein